MVADESQKFRVHVQAITSTRVTVTFRCGFGVFSGGFRRVKVVDAKINGGLTSFYQVNFKRNYLEATPGVEPRSTDLQSAAFSYISIIYRHCHAYCHAV